MIRLIRSAQTVRGKQMEAIAWGQQIVDFLNQKYPETTVQVFVSRFGQLGRIEWHLDFEDLAALDAYMQRMQADETYQQRAQAAMDLFVQGSVHDRLVATV